MDTKVKLANNALGFALLEASDELKSGGLVSAYSVTMALSLLAGGADDATNARLCEQLGVADTQKITTLLQPMAALLQDSGSEILSGGNAVFAESSFDINRDFGSHVMALGALINSNFTSLADAEGAINSWVDDQTRGMIPQLVDQSALQGIHLVLLNALSFMAKWEKPFDPSRTRRNEPFYDSTTRKKVDLMTRSGTKVLLCEAKDYTAISLPYKGGFSFIAWLPSSKQTVATLLPILQAEPLPSFIEDDVSLLAIPSFDLASKIDLKALLGKLDYPISADFSAMGSGPNYIDAILHSTKIQVDEEGTQAAAATAVMMKRSLPMGPELIFDKPFIFSIIAKDETALFTGIFH